MTNINRLMAVLVAMLLVPVLAFGHMKELKTAKDGFKYYEVEDVDGRYMIEDLDGTTLVPWQPRGYRIIYYEPDQTFSIIKDNTIKSYFKGFEGFTYGDYYSRDGKRLIDATPYDHASLLRIDDGRYFFMVFKDKKCAVLDGGGNMIIPYGNIGSYFYSYITNTINYKKGKNKYVDTGVPLSDAYKLKLYPTVSSNPEKANEASSAKPTASSTTKATTTTSNSATTAEPKIVINKSWLVHNVMHDGLKCMAIHVNMNAYNLVGQNINVTAFVDTKPGVGHNDTNGKYCNSQGKVVCFTNVTPKYQNSVWADLILYLPNDEIHPLAGKNDYNVRVFAFGPNNVRCNGEYLPFSMTGTSASPQAKATPKATPQATPKATPKAQSKPSGKQTYRRNDTGGSYEECTTNGTGTVVVTRYIKCPYCMGSGQRYDAYLGYSQCVCHSGWYLLGSWIELEEGIKEKAARVKKESRALKKGGKIKVVTFTDNGDLYFDCNIWYTNGIHESRRCKPCTICNNGICRACGGMGFKMVVGTIYTCQVCSGSGKCHYCRGTRYEVTLSVNNNGILTTQIGDKAFQSDLNNPDDNSSRRESVDDGPCKVCNHYYFMSHGGCDGSGVFHCFGCGWEDGLFTSDEARSRRHDCSNCGVTHTYYDNHSTGKDTYYGHYCRCKCKCHKK